MVRDGVVLENLQRVQMEEVGDQSEDALLARTVVAQKMAEDQAVVMVVVDRHLLDSIQQWITWQQKAQKAKAFSHHFYFSAEVNFFM